MHNLKKSKSKTIKKRYNNTLNKLSKSKITHILYGFSKEDIIKDFEKLKSITGSWQQRGWEGDLFADPVVIKFLKDEGIIITDWKEIMKRFEARK